MTSTHESSGLIGQRVKLYGARLGDARRRAALSQEAVHTRTGYPVRSLTRWENGECDPGLDAVVVLCRLYAVSLDWLAGDSVMEQKLTPGTTIVDMQAINTLRRLVAEGKTIHDVPRELIRDPGINCACTIPADPVVVGADAAEAVEAQLRELWKQLGGR